MVIANIDLENLMKRSMGSQYNNNLIRKVDVVVGCQVFWNEQNDFIFDTAI